MRYLFQGAAVATAIAGSITSVAPAGAQAPQTSPNPQIEIAYVQPTNPAFTSIYQRLMSRKVLETLQQFMAPLELPSNCKLVVKVDQCGGVSFRYRSGGPISICYEYIQEIERMAPKSTVALVQGQITPEGAIVGPVVQAVLHEVAIAAFDLLDIPIWGRIDDAADRVSAFIMLQFGPDVAWNAIVGTAWFLSGNATASADFSDARGAIAQRYYTTLCIAYGGETRGVYKIDPKLRRGFYNFVGAGAAGNSPADRARSCTEEYDIVRQGFDSLLLPHLDKALLKEVQGAKWVNFGG